MNSRMDFWSIPHMEYLKQCPEDVSGEILGWNLRGVLIWNSWRINRMGFLEELQDRSSFLFQEGKFLREFLDGIPGGTLG